MNYININGKLSAADNCSLPVDNRAFRYGYALYETMLMQNGTIQLADFHWQRLFFGTEHLGISIPKVLTAERLQNEVIQIAAKNKLDNLCRVRLQLYAGHGGLFDANNTAGYIIECFSINESITQWNEAGLVTGMATGLHKSNDNLANYKTANGLIYAMAAKQAKENKWNDALILNTSGNIIESAIANIFWVRDGQLFTPPLVDGCVAGVMRRYIMSKKQVIEKSLTIDELQNAESVFLTNAIRKMKWVRSVGSLQFAVGSLPNIYKELFP